VVLLAVFPERKIEEEPIEPPDTIQFERDRYQVAWGKKKRLRIEASVSLVAEFGKEVRVSSSDPGVVVLGSGAMLEIDDEREYCVATATVEARTMGANEKSTARIGDHVPTCNVLVAKDDAGSKIECRLVDEEAGGRRALVEQGAEGTLVKIMGQYPAFRRYLGPAPDFPKQDLGVTRALITEIIAGEAVRMVMERKYRAGAGRDLDAAALHTEHGQYLSRYLAKCHKAVIADSALQ